MVTQNDVFLAVYRITNRTTGHERHEVATSAQAACEQAGWLIGDCHIFRCDPSWHSRVGRHSALLVRLPCQVCAYQYAECCLPKRGHCPVRAVNPDLNTWLLNASKAHLCSHVGECLSKKDHENHKTWKTLPEAIKHLAAL